MGNGCTELIPAGRSYWLYLCSRRTPAKPLQAKATKTSSKQSFVDVLIAFCKCCVILPRLMLLLLLVDIVAYTFFIIPVLCLAKNVKSGYEALL